MIRPSILKAIVVVVLMTVNCFTHGQINPPGISNNAITDKSVKPYKILTNGKQITIQSKQDLKSVMVWSSSGHRIVEEKEMKENNYTFSVPAKEKIIFLKIITSDDKSYTEKIGIK